MRIGLLLLGWLWGAEYCCAGAAATCFWTVTFLLLTTGISGSGSLVRDGSDSGVAVALGSGDSLGSSVAASVVASAVLPAATRATVVDSGALLDAALITATLATEPAMRTPPAATTVAMMLDRCMLFSLNRKLSLRLDHLFALVMTLR